MGKASTSFGERLAELGISGTELDGDVAIMASGARCLMATLDQIVRYAGTARACIDLGGTVFNMETLPKILNGCLQDDFSRKKLHLGDIHSPRANSTLVTFMTQEGLQR